jgi:hypothetical protein
VYDTSDIGVFLGLDVGKGEHHAHGLTPAGKTVYDKRLPNTEPKLRALFDKLITKFGTVLVIVRSPTCRAWRCAGPRRCTRARPRPTPATLR